MSTASCEHCNTTFNFTKAHQRGRFCSLQCQADHRTATVTDPRVEAGLVSMRPTLRAYVIRKRGYKCEECTMTTWRGQAIPLELNHIDGDAGNNFPINLQMLCCNCHALTPTWKNRNFGKGRKSRGLK